MRYRSVSKVPDTARTVIALEYDTDIEQASLDIRSKDGRINTLSFDGLRLFRRQLDEFIYGLDIAMRDLEEAK